MLPVYPYGILTIHYPFKWTSFNMSMHVKDLLHGEMISFDASYP